MATQRATSLKSSRRKRMAQSWSSTCFSTQMNRPTVAIVWGFIDDDAEPRLVATVSNAWAAVAMRIRATHRPKGRIR